MRLGAIKLEKEAVEIELGLLKKEMAVTRSSVSAMDSSEMDKLIEGAATQSWGVPINLAPGRVVCMRSTNPVFDGAEACVVKFLTDKRGYILKTSKHGPNVFKEAAKLSLVHHMQEENDLKNDTNKEELARAIRAEAAINTNTLKEISDALQPRASELMVVQKPPTKSRPADEQTMFDAIVKNASLVKKEMDSLTGEPGRWKKTGSSRGVTSLTRSDMGKNGTVAIMGQGVVPAEKDAIIRFLQDPSLDIVDRQSVEIKKNFELDEGMSDNGELRYIKVKIPMCTSRDFCVASGGVSISTGQGEAMDEYVLGSSSVEHKLIPEVRGCIRARLVTSGWHIKPLGNGQCEVTLVSVTVMGGSFPSSLLKMGEKEGGKIVTSLKKAF